jgi:hypothetical protein
MKHVNYYASSTLFTDKIFMICILLYFTLPFIFSFPLNFSAKMSYSNYDFEDFNNFDEFEPFEQDAPPIEDEENNDNHDDSEDESSSQSRRTSLIWKYFNEQTIQHLGYPICCKCQCVFRKKTGISTLK